jgi:hypothetical protein
MRFVTETDVIAGSRVLADTRSVAVLAVAQFAALPAHAFALGAHMLAGTAVLRIAHEVGAAARRRLAHVIRTLLLSVATMVALPTVTVVGRQVRARRTA